MIGHFPQTNGATVQIQLNTDNHLAGSEHIALQLEADVRQALGPFTDRITRVEVHLADINGERPGGDDKRCMIEARVAGREPTSVSHQAPTVALAVEGAANKLARSLDRVFGKLDADRKNGARPADDDATPKPP